MSRKQKLGRNSPCPCGSGRKFKHCCLSQLSASHGQKNPVLDGAIEEALLSIVGHDPKAIENGIEWLNVFLSTTQARDHNWQTAALGVVQGLQHLGRHQDALNALNRLVEHPGGNQVAAAALKLSAVSLAALGNLDEACRRFEEALGMVPTNSSIRAAITTEAGKAYLMNEQPVRARELWLESLRYYEKTNNIEDIARVQSNLAFVDLNDLNSDDETQEKAIQRIEEASEIKASIGDLSGLCSNYSNLSLYYRRKRRYGRAIAFARRDLSLSRDIGDQWGIATSLIYLGAIYIDVLQPHAARSVTQEALAIGKQLRDETIIAKAEHNLRGIAAEASYAARSGKVLGPRAICKCGSGQIYEDCCGRADFEPVSLPTIVGVHPDSERISAENDAAGIAFSRLDFIFNRSETVRDRRAWLRTTVRDGWLEMTALPDAVNLHLLASRELTKTAFQNPEGTEGPLAALILSVCAVEAFVNQAAFFLKDVHNRQASPPHILPTELKGDILEFQRRTSLTEKWDILGGALCDSGWPPPKSLSEDFSRLVDLRNEMVHFKSAEYEQLIPPPKNPHRMLRRLPAGVVPRTNREPWPMRILTPALGKWALETAERTIDYFRDEYRKGRLRSGRPK